MLFNIIIVIGSVRALGYEPFWDKSSIRFFYFEDKMYISLHIYERNDNPRCKSIPSFK